MSYEIYIDIQTKENVSVKELFEKLILFAKKHNLDYLEKDGEFKSNGKVYSKGEKNFILKKNSKLYLTISLVDRNNKVRFYFSDWDWFDEKLYSIYEKYIILMAELINNYMGIEYAFGDFELTYNDYQGKETIFWFNYFEKEMVDKIGRSKFNGLPVHLLKEYDDGDILLISYDPSNTDGNHKIIIIGKICNQLNFGIKSFEEQLERSSKSKEFISEVNEKIEDKDYDVMADIEKWKKLCEGDKKC